MKTWVAYSDAWQAAWSPTYLETGIGSFQKIILARDLMRTAS